MDQTREGNRDNLGGQHRKRDSEFAADTVAEHRSESWPLPQRRQLNEPERIQ
jgi:hypothetical protein